jgi:hypothetical protein
MECYVSTNTKKYQVIEKFKMGESYCNDPRCQRNRNGERHESHNERIIQNETTVERLFGTTETYPYCNDPRCQTNRGGVRHRPHSSENPYFYYIQYLGGHKAYPSPSSTTMHFYEDRIEVGSPKLVIPYRSMKNIENMTEKRISILRVIAWPNFRSTCYSWCFVEKESYLSCNSVQ